MSILNRIKEESKKAGQSKGKFIFFREGEKRRIRFLTDLEDGLEIVFHDSYQDGINVPCQEIYGKSCPYCEQEGLRTRSLFAWSVYDYEAKEVKILMQAVNSFTAVPMLAALYETYGTLLDRDMIVTRTGSGQNTAYTVVAADKNKFRNERAKALAKKSILKYLDQAYPDENKEDDDEYDDEEYETSRKDKKGKKPSTSKANEDWDDDDEDDDTIDYSELSAKELYKLCKERDLDVLPKKSEKYYIKQLEEYDNALNDWDDDDEDEEDDWEE